MLLREATCGVGVGVGEVEVEVLTARALEVSEAGGPTIVLCFSVPSGRGP